MGVNALLAAIKNSHILTGNNLGPLSNLNEMPMVDATFNDDRLKNIVQYYSINPYEMEKKLQFYANELLSAGKVNQAWQVLLALN